MAQPEKAHDSGGRHDSGAHFELPVDRLPGEADGPDMTRYAVGDPEDATAPVVVCARFPAGFVLGPHTHDTDYSEIVLRGAQRVGRTWYHPGDARVVKAGTVYGPLEAGPEGAVVLVVFRDGRRHMLPPRPGVGVWYEPRGDRRQYAVKREDGEGVDPVGAR